MKKVIGVMGPNLEKSSEDDLKVAFEVGKIVAESGAVLLCGGRTGVMEYSAKGAKESSGLTIGICPTDNKNDLNPYIDIPIVTAMRGGRNFMNILSSDLVIFVSVLSAGTLSELAYAIQLEKPIIIINGTDKLRAYIEEFQSPTLYFVETLQELEEKIKTLI